MRTDSERKATVAEHELTRRETLRKGAVASGGLFVGGPVVSGSVKSKRGGTGFLAEGSGIEVGKTFTTIDRESTRVRIGVECEANERTRSRYTKYRIAGPDIFSLFLWVKGRDPLGIGDEFKVNNVRECGTLTLIDGSFEAEKITFSPARP